MHIMHNDRYGGHYNGGQGRSLRTLLKMDSVSDDDDVSCNIPEDEVLEIKRAMVSSLYS